MCETVMKLEGERLRPVDYCLFIMTDIGLQAGPNAARGVEIVPSILQRCDASTMWIGGTNAHRALRTQRVRGRRSRRSGVKSGDATRAKDLTEDCVRVYCLHRICSVCGAMRHGAISPARQRQVGHPVKLSELHAASTCLHAV